MKNKILILCTCLSLVCFSAYNLKAQEVDDAGGANAIAYAHGIRRKWAAAAVFFFFFKH